MNSATLEVPTTSVNIGAAVKPSFGNGRYSAEMERIFNDVQKLFGVSPEKAEKIARQAGTDAGAVFKLASASIKVGSVKSKDATATIKDASEVKGVTMTNSLFVVRAIQWAADAQKNGVSYGFTKWAFIPPVQEWIDGLN